MYAPTRMEPSGPTSTYRRPRSVDAVLAELEQPGAVLLAGGTDFYPQRLNLPARGEHVIDIASIEALRGIRHEGSSWRFGAATTWTDVARASLPPAFAGLQQAAARIGGVQIQNAGTIAGNLCTASPAADSVPPLLALDAQVELRSRAGTRSLPIGDFITGYRQTALQPGELVTAVIVPDAHPDANGAFVKLGQRAYLVISIAMVACVAVVDEQRVSAAAIAVGACSPVAVRLPALEAALVGAADLCEVTSIVAGADLSALSPIDDVRASAGYREDAVRQLIVDCIANATGLA